MSNQQRNILLAYYGDDFTGSTDALECLCRAGASAVLFTEPPDAATLAKFPQLDAFGVSGNTRALRPDTMQQVLEPAFTKMKSTGARHVHYKTCSTFDSSPIIGSIGRAIDCGLAIFNNRYTPIVGGAPALGRYCAFGNLFARMGIGSTGAVYRLDRHPSMSQHPVTPAHESDLRLHLAEQTRERIGLIDLVKQKQPVPQWLAGSDERILLLDAMEETDLLRIGEWLDALAGNDCQFSVGPSSIDMALGAYWNQQGKWKPRNEWPPVEEQGALLVVSGSCSPVTTGQIDTARAQGFSCIALDPAGLCNGTVDALPELPRLLQGLCAGEKLLVHTGQRQATLLPSDQLGEALGRLIKYCTVQTGLRKLVLSGGDTSSYAARAMGIDAVEMIAPLVIGAPWCRAHSGNPVINGMLVNFKGGQVGGPDYFIKAAG